MRNNSYTPETTYEPVINDIFLKNQNNQRNLVLETNIHDTTTLEDILLGLGDIKSMAEGELGAFDNIDIRLH